MCIFSPTKPKLGGSLGVIHLTTLDDEMLRNGIPLVGERKTTRTFVTAVNPS